MSHGASINTTMTYAEGGVDVVAAAARSPLVARLFCGLLKPTRKSGPAPLLVVMATGVGLICILLSTFRSVGETTACKPNVYPVQSTERTESFRILWI